MDGFLGRRSGSCQSHEAQHRMIALQDPRLPSTHTLPAEDRTIHAPECRQGFQHRLPSHPHSPLPRLGRRGCHREQIDLPRSSRESMAPHQLRYRPCLH